MPLRTAARAFLAAFTFLLASGCTATYRAPSGEPPVVEQQDQETSRIMVDFGNTRRDVLNGSLGSSRSQEFVVDVPPSEKVFVIGFCDLHCDDLDLLIARGEKNLDWDSEPDDNPEVEVTNHPGGRLTVVVSMAVCNRPRCQFRAIVFTK
jgi:hypothetical protein